MKKGILLLIALVFAFSNVIFSQAGLLDNSFGLEGKVTTELYKSHDDLKWAALQSDGKIIMAGYSGSLFEYIRLILVRLKADGSFDTDFGENGIVNTGLYGIDNGYFGGKSLLALQPFDGKIVVFNNEGTDFSLARFNADGSSDSEFGSNGISFQSGFEAWAISIQPDGKILIAGASNGNYGLLRFLPDGSLDNGFGTNGLVTTDLGFENEFANQIALQSDGRIVLAGYNYSSGVSQLALTRYLENGDLDSSFADGGILGGIAPYEASSLIAHGDKILLSVYTFLFQFNQDGTPDGDFGTNGMAQSFGDGIATANVQPDGKIMAVVRDWFTEDETTLERHNADGSYDNTFYSNLEDGRNLLHQLIFQPDGKTLAVGNSEFYSRDFALTRFNANGDIDPEFGDDGKLVLNLGRSTESANDLIIQPDGSIVAAGGCENGYGLARYETNGLLENNFGAGGVLTGYVNLYSYLNSFLTRTIRSLAVQADGKILVAGDIVDVYGYGGFLVRHQSDGKVDFEAGGNEIALQNDGKILVAGRYNDDFSFHQTYIYRLHESGLIDSTFGTNGKVIITSSGMSAGGAYFPIPVLLPDNKILIACWLSESGTSKVTFFKYDSTGALDSTFGSNGKYVTNWEGWGEINSMICQSDGKIVVAGGDVFARFNPDGTIDNEFGTDGFVSPGFSTHIALQSDGKILAVGTDNGDFAMLRYNEDGSLDNDFGQNGLVKTDFNNGDDKANAIAIQPDGKIVVAGESDGDFAIARYLSGLETNVFDKAKTNSNPIQLFPNPTNDFLTLGLPDYAQPSYLEILDASGRLVASHKSVNKLQISVRHLPSGYYTVRAADGQRVYIGKFIKQ